MKAPDIVNAESFDVLPILGVFHTMMSYVGSIGALMNESGPSESLVMEFGTNTVPKITDRKVISRAIRTHFLTKAEEVEDAEENVEMNDMNPDVVSERITDKTSNGRKTAYTLKYLGV